MLHYSSQVQHPTRHLRLTFFYELEAELLWALFYGPVSRRAHSS